MNSRGSIRWGVLGVSCWAIGLFLPFPVWGEEAPLDSAPPKIDRPAPAHVHNPDIHHQKPKRKFNPHFSFNVTNNFYSQYIWRGIPASKGFVWQPSITLEAYGVGFSVWGNFVLDNEPNQDQFNEVDFTLYYRRKIKKLAMQTWFILDIYPNGNPASLDDGTTSLEYDLHLAYPVGPIDLFTHFAVRLVSAPGSIWWEVGLGYQRDLPLGFAIDTSALFGLGDSRFNEAHFGVDSTEPNQFLYSLALPWEPIHGVIFAPTMHVSTILSTALQARTSQDVIVYGGISIQYNLTKKRH